jgi:hypothetical protein
MQRVEEIAIVPESFHAERGKPRRDSGRRAIQYGCRYEPAEPAVTYWALEDGDAIVADLDIAGGDRVLSIEPDAEIELGYMHMELVERTPAGEIVLQRFPDQDIRLHNRKPVARTIGVESTVLVRIRAELTSNGTARRVFGVYLRVVRASRSS